MKLRQLITTLALAVGFTATAATPVAVWDGDFTTATKSGYTLTRKVGGEMPPEPGELPLWTDTLLIDKATSYGKGAILVKYSGYTANEDVDNTALASAWPYNKSPDAGCEANGGILKTYWGTTVNRQNWTQIGSYSKDNITVPESGYLILAFNTDTGTATFITDANKSEWKGGYDAGIKWTGQNRASVYGYAVGGPRNDLPASTMGPCETITIESVAVFEDYNGLDQVGIEGIMAYQFPSEVREFYATLDGRVNGWSDLDVYGMWSPEPPPEGFSATDTLVITNEAIQSFTMDMDVTALKLKFVSSPDAPALQLTADEEEVSLEIGTYDFSEAESKTTVKYGMTASVVAGKDTVLEKANDPSLTIAEGNKLTVKNGSLTASKVSNAGTLHFMGGTAASPIALTGNANFGVITLDENTYVKHDDKAGNRKYQVTGSGARSFYEVTRNNGGSAGMADGSTFENLILVSGATGGDTTWLERATLTNVGLDAKGAFKINDFTPTIRSLTGSGTVGKNKTAALTIACTEAANYAGASDLAFTIAEGTALQTLSGAYTGALTVEEDGQVKLMGAAKPSSISGAGSVTIGGTGAVTNTSDLANFTGTITVDAGVTTLNLGTSRPTCDFVFAGTTEVVYTENVADDGVVQELNVMSGTVSGYKVIGIDGTEKTVTEGKYTPTVTSKAALYAWEFNGTLASVGQDTGTMGKDHGPFYTDDNEAVYAYSQPYYNVSWPTEFTTMIACTLPTNANVCLVGWGKASPGGIALISGDVSKNEVKMVTWQNNQQYTVLASMTVPNAFDCEHLYLFSKTADGVKIYLDGSLVVNYSGSISIANGVQIGTVFQGVPTGIIRLDNVYSGTNTCKAVIDSLRVYNSVLGPNAIAELVKEFPYESPNGTFTRALTGTDNQWVAEDAWTKVGPETTFAAPDAGSTVNLSAEEDATITLNLEEPVDYEALNLTGDGAITIAAAANANKISSSGLVKIGSDATIQYSAMSLAGTSIEVAAGKTLTVDCSMIDLSQYYASTTIPLTGIVTGDGELGFEVPEAITGRSAEAQFNESNNTWELKITVISAPFIYDGGEWTWSGEAVSAETVSNNTDVVVLVRSGTLEWPMDRAEFEVQDGTLKATEVGTSTITVSGGAFDVNGLSGSLYTVILNGGSLVNNGERIGDAKQITAINLTDDSTVGGLYDFALQGTAASQYGATSMNLDYTLTKTGTNSFALVNTTIDGTGTLYVEEGEVYSSESTVFTNGTLKIGKNGTFKQRANGNTLTIAKIVGEGGTLNNLGTVSDFTLEGTLNIANAGTYGTITLNSKIMNPATLYVGEKRGLVLEGEGTVNAQLTLVEMAAAEPLTLFTTTEGEFDVVLTDYNGRELEPGEDYTIEGGVVTPTAIPFRYNNKWTWNGDDVEASTVQTLTGADIIVEAGTCEWNIDRDITVNGGTLKATGAKKANAAITVGEDGTFDVNGRENTTWTVLLKGGSLVNNGTAIGNTKKQINLLTVADADSTVDAAANFGLIADGYKATTLDLGGQKLTKTGEATFWICNATVENGTFEVAGGTLEVTGNADTHVTVFANDASLVLDEGTTLAVARPLTIGAIEAKGATINNTKSITPFTLKGEATLTGNGTYDTITLDSKLMKPAVLNVGTIRGLTIAGDGTVNAVLTAAEIAQEGPIAIFTTESDYVAGGTVKDVNGNVVPGSFSGGTFQVSHEATDGTTFYLTLADALTNATDGATITVLKDLTVAARIDIDPTKSITLDANSKAITIATNIYAFVYGGATETTGEGTFTVKGDGTFYAPTADKTCFLWARRGNIVVENGSFSMDGSAQCVYADNGCTATISGGTFVNRTGADVLNVHNTRSVVTDIQVSGGSYSRDPALGDDALGGTFVAEGYESVKEGDYWKVQEKAGVPSWIDPSDTTNAALYNAWAETYGVTNPAEANEDAFLFNVDNTDAAVAEAEEEFTLTITFDAAGNPVVECPNEEYYNGTVVLWGKAALTDDTWHAKKAGDQFFKATLELIPGN